MSAALAWAASCVVWTSDTSVTGNPSARARRVVVSTQYSVEQMLDVIFTVGQYHLVSFALNSCGVVLDDGIPDVL